MRRTKTRVLALGAILSALAVVVMMLGGLIPVATFCCPILAGFVLVPVLFEGGAAMALCAYGAVAVLSLLLGPDKEAAMLYALLGWYPALRPRLQRLPRLLRRAVKLLLFNCAVAAAYALLIFLLGFDALRSELFGMGLWVFLGTLLLGNAVFVLFDFTLPRVTLIYQYRFRPRFWK